jgi:hypothetical protein
MTHQKSGARDTIQIGEARSTLHTVLAGAPDPRSASVKADHGELANSSSIAISASA